jgi:hypothetical protein
MMGMMGLMMLGAVLFLVVMAVVIWLLVRWLNQRQMPRMPDTSRSPYPYQGYEQGYQPPQPLSDSYQEDGRHDRSPQPKQQHDQPYIPYPQEQEMPPQS